MKKQYLSIFLALAFTIAPLTGCGGTSSAPATASSSSSEVSSEETSSEETTDTSSDTSASSSDEVIISISSEPSTLDPTAGWGHGSAPLIQSTLVEYRQDMTFENDLATDYSLSEDGLTWTFTIRDDAFFTDGEPVKASDVVFTFETAMNTASSLDLTFLESVEEDADGNIVFHMKQPASTFLNTIASVGIIPEHLYNEGYGDAPVGSGPFKFVQWNKQEQLMLEANEDYYGEVPSIKKVTILFQDEDAAFASVKAGIVDIALTSATLATQEIEGYNVQAVSTVDNRGFTMPMSPGGSGTTESGYPYGNDVTSHLEIRQAIAYALDREMLANDALNGFARPCYSENDGFPWNNPDVALETDVEYAKTLLADNGWEDTDGDGIVELDGLKASFTVMYPSGDSLRQAVSLAAAQQLKEIGIEINVEGMSWDEIAKRMFSDVVCMGWGSSNPYTSYLLFHSSGMLKDDYYNPEGYSNDTVDGYFEAAMTSLTTEEANENWKKAQWDGSTGTAMQGDCPWVWLVNIDHLYYVKEGLDIGDQQLHAHGASMPLIQNLKEWTWNN